MSDVTGRSRFDLLDQEQLAAQLVAIMGARFQRPTADEKRHILKLVEGQIRATEADVLRAGDPISRERLLDRHVLGSPA